MQLLRSLPLLCLIGASSAWAGGPGGTFEFKVTSARANGNIKVAVSGKDMRSDMDMSAAGMGQMQLSMLVKDEQGYLLNVKEKTYSPVDMGSRGKKGGGGKDRKFTVKIIGPEKVSKWSAVHAEVTNERGEKMDVWTSKDVDAGRSIFEVLGQGGEDNSGLVKALADAGAPGFPVRMVSHGDGAITMELVKYDGATPAAKNFDLSGWKQADTAEVAGGALPPEARKKMEEALKNMTPEQRKALEEAMKRQRQ